MTTSTSWRARIGLVAFGLIAGVILLEAGLRAAGFVLTYLQERANRRSRQASEVAGKSKDTYVIMCLGESTTALGGDQAYPRQLEEILNKQDIGVRFSVLNKGIAGANTASILALLGKYLDECRPDLVVTMIGINDGLAAAGRLDATVAAGRRPGFFERFRVYKLARLLFEHGRATWSGWRQGKKLFGGPGLPKASEESSPFPAGADNPARHLKRGEWYLNYDRWDLALPCFREAHRLNPQATEAMIGMGVCLRESGEPRESEIWLSRAREAEPGSVRALVELGNLFHDQKNIDKARQLFRKAITIDPVYLPAYQGLAGIAERAGENEEAGSVWEEAGAADPESCEIRLARAEFLGRQKHPDAARNVWEEARDFCPDHDRYRFVLGDIFASAGDDRQAIAAYRSAAEAGGWKPAAAMRLAEFCRQRGRTEEGAEACRAMLGANPDDHEALCAAGLYHLNTGRAEEGERLLVASIRKAPWDAIGYASLGEYYSKNGRWEEAAEAWRGVLILFPRNETAVNRLVSCLKENGEMAAARDALAALLQGDSSDATLHREWGRICAEQGETQEAEKHFRAAMQLRPDDPLPPVLLSRVMAETGRDEEARTLRRRAAELEPQNPELYDSVMVLARQARNRGEAAGAESLYREAIELRPDRDNAFAELGQYLSWQNRIAEAEGALRGALRLNPRNCLALAELAFILDRRGRPNEGEALYRQALQADPLYNFAFTQMVTRLMGQRRYREAEEICRRTLQANPENDRAWSALARCHETQGETALAELFLARANELRTRSEFSLLARNYQAILGILQKRNVRLACVQYPMRPLGQLTGLFPDPEGIVFVDNEETFKAAVRKNGFEEIFADNFAGDFGHCTPQGNRLLAENVANAIIRGVFEGKNREGRPETTNGAN